MFQRVSLWLLATAGVLLGHVIGYGAAYPDEMERSVALAGHAYLGPASTVLIPVGLLSVLGIAVRTVRRMGPADVPTLRHLATAQIGLFLAQEVLERVAGPASPADALTERGVWFGVVAQVIVAWVALWLVRVTVAVARAIATPASPVTASEPSLRSLAGTQVVRGQHRAALLPLRRGPPVHGVSVST